MSASLFRDKIASQRSQNYASMSTATNFLSYNSKIRVLFKLEFIVNKDLKTLDH